MIRIHLSVAILLLLVSSNIAFAQDSVQIGQAFLDLSSDGVLMNISAHPDDEDGSTLAYYRMKYGVKTYSVLFTRGEGGQNEKGPELYQDLGVLRSAETEAAGVILGTHVRFLNFLDFGYSKTATEAFRIWGGQTEALRRLVYVIRKYKPDILFTNHNTIDGHGHHQAAAITAIAAFDAAADSTLFPEQLREPGMSLWQPKKLFMRVFGRLEQTADVANTIEEIDPLRHLDYIEIATQALQQHKTQGLERANLRAFIRGKSLYRLMRASSLFDRDTTSFFGGVDFWRDDALSFLLPYRDRIREFRSDLPLESFLTRSSLLLLKLDSLAGLPGLSPLARRLISDWAGKLVHCVTVRAGVEVNARCADSVLVIRQSVPISVSLSAKRATLSGARFSFETPAGWSVNENPGVAPSLSPTALGRSYLLTVGENAIMTLPRATAQYRSLGLRQSVCVTARCLLNGHPFAFQVPVPFDVAPREELSIEPGEMRLDPEQLQEHLRVKYTVINHSPQKIGGRVWLEGPAGWKGDLAGFVIDREDSAVSGELAVKPPPGIREGDYTLRFRTDEAFAEATVRVFSVRAAPGLHVGVVRSYDTTLEQALQELKVDYQQLTDADLASGDLSRWNTIVLDIRAYLVRDALKKNNARLLEYVAKGGNLVVMYQREQEWLPEYAPYPFQLSRRRITAEDAPVDILQPDHPLLVRPNRIVPADWNGWKQERAVYMPADVPQAYLRLLSSHDPDEQELDTGYLVAASGKGSYIYTSYVWYRELKEFVPGAFRCFANMISYPVVRK
jgi:LmbE family N-acetylglucosaminyl deacetylase